MMQLPSMRTGENKLRPSPRRIPTHRVGANLFARRGHEREREADLEILPRFEGARQ